MKNNILLISLLLIVLSSCRPKKEIPNTTIAKKDSISDTYIGLDCTLNKDVKKGLPLYEVWALVEDSRSMVDVSWGCEIFDKDIYERYDIPAEAVAACGGWDEEAGKANFFYLIKDQTLGYVIYKGSMDVEAEIEDYDYKIVYKYLDKINDTTVKD